MWRTAIGLEQGPVSTPIPIYILSNTAYGTNLVCNVLVYHWPSPPISHARLANLCLAQGLMPCFYVFYSSPTLS